MNVTEVGLVIKGNAEAINQGVNLISLISDEQYTHIASPYVSSSIGEHFRHIVDLYLAVMNGIEKGVIDYDVRRRGAPIETSRAHAIKELEGIGQWMGKMWDYVQGALVDADKPVMVLSEVSLRDTERVRVESTYARELIFTSSHAVHHFSVIGIIAKLQNIDVEAGLGVAPATASYIRDKNVSATK